MEKRVEYDLKYLENWSLLLDLQIIYRTVRNMIAGEKNAY
jgi:putative colanic acid biosynthesis UDP-glucose lipid carrier transferase